MTCTSSLGRHVLQQVSASSSFECTLDLHIAFKGREHDDTGLRKFGPDRDQCVDPAQVGQPEVHQRHIGPVLPILLNGLVPAGSLGDKHHIGLVIDDRRDPLAQECVVIHAEHSNAALVVQLSAPFLSPACPRTCMLNHDGLRIAAQFNATPPGTESSTSVPAEALLITQKSGAYSIRPFAHPRQAPCPSRPCRKMSGSIPQPSSRTRMRNRFGE